MGIAQLGLAPQFEQPPGCSAERVLSTFCSSRAASILGLTACFPALRVCFYYKQQSALQGSLYKIMIHLIWKHFFRFFPTLSLIETSTQGCCSSSEGRAWPSPLGYMVPSQEAKAVAPFVLKFSSEFSL